MEHKLVYPGEDLYQRVHYDRHEDKTIIETFQDITPIIDANKRMYSANQINKHSKSRGTRHIMGEHKACIPLVILHKWMKEFQQKTGSQFPPQMHNEDFKKYIKSKLNDPEYRFFRVDGRKN